MFLLDTSTSINFGEPPRAPSRRLFQTEVLPFVSDVSRRQSIGPHDGDSRVGVATFDSLANLRIPLNAHFVHSNLRDAINTNVSYDAGVTKMSLGLQLIRDEMLNVENGARPLSASVPRVLVVMTDGEATTGFEPETADLNAESMISFIESVKSGKLVGEPVKSHEDDEAMHDEL